MSVLTLELPETLHQQLEAQARSEGVALAQFVLTALQQRASFHYRQEELSPAAVRQQQESFDHLVAGLRSAPEAEIDKILAERERTETPSELPPEMIERVKARIQSKRASF